MAGFTYRVSLGGTHRAAPASLDKAPLRMDYRGAGSNPGGFVKDPALGVNEGMVILSDLVDLNDNSLAADARDVIKVLTQNQDAAETGSPKYRKLQTGSEYWQIRVGNNLAFYPVTTFQGSGAAMKYGNLIDGAIGQTATASLDMHDLANLRIPAAGLMLPVLSRTGTVKNINYPVNLRWEGLEQKISPGAGVTFFDSLIAFPAFSIPIAVAWRVNTTIAGPANMDIGTVATPQLFATAVGVAVSNSGFRPRSAFFAPLVATVIRFTFNVATSDAAGRIGLLLYYLEGDAVSAQDESFDA